MCLVSSYGCEFLSDFLHSLKATFILLLSPFASSHLFILPYLSELNQRNTPTKTLILFPVILLSLTITSDSVFPQSRIQYRILSSLHLCSILVQETVSRITLLPPVLSVHPFAHPVISDSTKCNIDSFRFL